MASHSPFSQKENSLFKRALKCCETKQYKHGLKLTNQILSNPKYAEHGETLSLKGLLLFHLGRKDQAYELVKRGLKYDLKSCLSWHCYGILHRGDRNYEEAIKCFRNALKWENDNVQILQDMSGLQVQTNDFDGYLDTCYKILPLVPTYHAAWIGFALAHHLAGEYSICLDILRSIRQNLEGRSSSEFELSELLLYQGTVMEESGDLEGSIQYLLKSKEFICDKLSLNESLAKMYLMTSQMDEAENIIRDLIVRNPHCNTYYIWLFQALRLHTNEEKLLELRRLMNGMPNVSALKRAILTHSSNEDFKFHVDKYLKECLLKGVPSLFADLKGLYSDVSKREIVETLLLSYEQSLKKSKSLLGIGDSNTKEYPTVFLWTLYYLAQHCDFCDRTDEALKYIDEAIEHTPTLVDLYIAKAKILKRGGDILRAVVFIDKAQSLDTSDRYINSVCVKYLLDANMVTEAEELATHFCFNGSPGTIEILNEMQCIWYLTRCALAYERLGNYGEALKKCHEVNNHFLQFWQDQLDFHYYSLRNVCLRQYVQLIRQSNKFKKHRFYNRIAACAIRIYLRLFDNPSEKDNLKPDIGEKLAESELKKLKNKERKAKKKAELLKVITDDKKEFSLKDSPTLDPHKLLEIKEPLEEAKRFLIPLQELISDAVTTHLLAYEIYSRKGKILLMLQSITRAWTVDCDSPKLHEVLIKFVKEINDLKISGNLNYPIRDVIEKRMTPLIGDKTPQELNDGYLTKNIASLPARVAVAKSMYFLDKSKQQQALDLVTGIHSQIENVSVQNCQNILKILMDGTFGTFPPSYIENFKKICQEKFPYAADFVL